MSSEFFFWWIIIRNCVIVSKWQQNPGSQCLRGLNHSSGQLCFSVGSGKKDSWPKFSFGHRAKSWSLKCRTTEGQGQMLLTAIFAPQQASVLFSSPSSKAARRNNWWLRFGETAGVCRGSSLITCFFRMLEIQSEVQQGILSSFF